MSTARITKAAVAALPPGGAIWDTDVRGFGARRHRRDATYVLKLRVGGRQRMLAIGRHGAPSTPRRRPAARRRHD